MFVDVKNGMLAGHFFLSLSKRIYLTHLVCVSKYIKRMDTYSYDGSGLRLLLN